MAIQDYEGNIHKDYNITTPNVYAGSGQECGTVWYSSVSQARAVIKAHRGQAPKGEDSGLCPQCSRHYSSNSPEYRAFPEFACEEWKHNKARQGQE